MAYAGYAGYAGIAGTIPALSTSGATNVTATGATLNGSIDSTGGENVTMRGFEYGPTIAYGNGISTSGSYGTGIFSANLSDIARNTTYHFRAMATDSAGTAYGNDQTFTTTSSTATGVQYTYSKTGGIDALYYNGQIYSAPPTHDHYVTSAVFKAPDGTQKPYGWVTNSLGDLGVGGAICSTHTNPDFTQQIYRLGQDGFTLKWDYSTPDSKTFKMTVSVTNTDPTDSLIGINLEYFFWFVTPGISSPPPNTFFAIGTQGPGVPAIFTKGDWGSAAMFTDDYSKQWQFGNVWSTGGFAKQTMLFCLQKTSSAAIAPGRTDHYTLYIRFGSATDSAANLAPEAFSAYRSSFPYLVNWPNRAPVARWFVAEGEAHASALNPRGYLWDPNLDVSNQSSFNSRVLSLTDDIVARLNGMHPRPQGIIIWDLEGQEFSQYFTYVGYPNKLHDLAPEMDAVADSMFAKFTKAGYTIGLTLRPGDFQTGTTLPATCHCDAGNIDFQDVFIKTDGTFPYRGYGCTADNTWTNANARWPYHQHSSWDDAIILRNLELKVAYARTRWGARMFYIDSTVYSDNGGGNPFNFEILRQLQKDFPDCVFFPENEGTYFWGASAPYNQSNMGMFNTPQYVKDIYPQAFSILQSLDGVDFANQQTHNALVQSVKDGNILFVNGWYDDPHNTQILNIYQDASASSVLKPLVNGATRSFLSQNPVFKGHLVLEKNMVGKELLFYTIAGQKVKSLKTDKTVLTLHELALVNGTYLLKIEGEKRTYKITIMK